MKLQAFTAIALLHPEESHLVVKEKGSEEENTELILEPTVVLAATAESARVLASRKIDEKHTKFMHRVEVVVRPF
jgi:hypothetical protein